MELLWAGTPYSLLAPPLFQEPVQNMSKPEKSGLGFVSSPGQRRGTGEASRSKQAWSLISV